MNYQIVAVRVFTHDWTTSTAFYRDTLQLPEKFSDAEMGWAEFDVGGPSLAVERADPEDSEHPDLVGRFLGVSLQVADIEAQPAALGRCAGTPGRSGWQRAHAAG